MSVDNNSLTPASKKFLCHFLDLNCSTLYSFSAKELLERDGIGEILAEGHVENWSEIWNSGNIILNGPSLDYRLQEAIIGNN